MSSNAEEVAARETEHLKAAILERVDQLGAEQRHAIELLVNDFSDSVRHEEHARFERRMRGLGFFLKHYGARELWTAIWLRFAVNVWQPEGWGIGPHGSGIYQPGDEWRFVDRLPAAERAESRA